MTANGPALRDRPPVGIGAEHHRISLVLEDTVRQFQRPLLRYARHMLPDRPDEAQDVVQNTFLRFRKTLLNGKALDNTKAWLYRVVHNLAIDLNRRQSHQTSLDSPPGDNGEAIPESMDEAPSPAGCAAGSDTRNVVLRELHRLPEDDRRILLMKLFEEMTLREISEMTGMNIATIHYRLNRGLDALRRQFRALGILEAEG